MKRCSTCNRTYTDPNLRFCIDDGTPLTEVAENDDATVVRPRTGEEDEWNAMAYRPPSPYVPPGSDGKPRRAWPWVVGIVGAFILGILMIGIALAILAPRLRRLDRNERARANVNQIENSSTPPAEVNANSNATEHVDTAPPSDHDQVLTQLKDIENEWTVANLNADKKKLDRILADDFVGKGPDGGLETKADYIRTIERDTDVQKWDFDNLKLTLAGDRATLSGTITYFVGERSVTFDFTDKFVWRDARWQATGAEIKERGSGETDL
jgi:HAMP domain-containing protein